MSERPILFNGEMVRAILNGRKTQTRRVVKWKMRPGQEGLNLGFSGLEVGYYCGGVPSSGWVLRSRGQNSCWNDRTYPIHCPYGSPGDRLWVRETFAVVCHEGEEGVVVHRRGDDEFWVDYRATPWDDADRPAGWHNAPNDPQSLRWRPSIHMPRWASRITLEVTEVRVQRVQEISPEDIAAEGIDICPEGARTDFDPYDEWVRLWDSINNKRGYGWDVNPWVWAVTFRLVEER